MMVQELMLQVTDKINYGTDPGLNIEIKDFFRGCEDVENFNISISEDKRYKISVKLKKFSLIEAKKVFSAFLRFVEYPAGNFYTRDSKEELVEYTLISFKQDLKGFCCEIQFLP